MRTRSIIRNCNFYLFNGFGLAIVADGDPFLQGVGNVNGFDVEHIQCTIMARLGFTLDIPMPMPGPADIR